jgi:hypothetical protein
MEFIHEKEGVPVMRQSIIFNGKELEWRWKLLDSKSWRDFRFHKVKCLMR